MGLSLAGSFLQLNVPERFGTAGGGKGIPAQGVPVLPLANTPWNSAGESLIPQVSSNLLFRPLCLLLKDAGCLQWLFFFFSFLSPQSLRRMCCSQRSTA